MRFRKTPLNLRQNYTYHHDNGDKVIIEIGKSTTIYANGTVEVNIDDSITELTIKELHRQDDAEVRSNLKQINCEDNEERQKRIENKKKWSEEHPNEYEDDNPYSKPKRLMSLDPFMEDGDFDEDKSRILYEAAKYQESMNSDDLKEEREMVKAYVATLPKSMQELYELLYIKEKTQAEIYKELGLSKSTVSERVKTLNNKIMKHFKENPNFESKDADYDLEGGKPSRK